MAKCLHLVLLVVGVGIPFAPANAADPHARIPADTGLFIQVRAGLLLNGPLVDRDKPITLRELVKRDHPDANVLGVKVLENIDKAWIALPSVGDVKKIFAVLEGRFDAEAIGKALVDHYGAQLKTHAIKESKQYWEFPIQELKFREWKSPGTLFVAVPDSATLLLSLGDEDSIRQALLGKAGGTPSALRALMDNSNPDQAIAFVFLNQLGGPLAERKDARRAFELFQSGAGGVRIDEEGSGQFSLTSSDVQSAQELEDLLRKGLNLLTGGVALLSQTNRDLRPVLDVVRTCRVSTKGKLVNVRGKMEKDLLEELIKRPK